MRERVEFAGPPECPERFAACLLPADGQALAREVRRLRAWAAEAWARCGEVTP